MFAFHCRLRVLSFESTCNQLGCLLEAGWLFHNRRFAGRRAVRRMRTTTAKRRAMVISSHNEARAAGNAPVLNNVSRRLMKHWPLANARCKFWVALPGLPKR
jgi:hypothetical protein